ncbi:alpha/beta hydrolase [Paraliomyxa miuraensis]|uniref:hypothetical protein n=1 Tax=Paraliomyxa miuraensis TaxID=376150 RepID=UPI0022588486|nr:hypothetical protein [Paraliomyxa miuraensis]MCX4241796.1 hypothetical protein [Paraliomyxa miuraensis]
MTIDGTATTGADVTGPDTGTATDTTGDVDCSEYPLPFPSLGFDDFEPHREDDGGLVIPQVAPAHCPSLGLDDPLSAAFYVYRPFDPDPMNMDDGWPAGQFPLVVFAEPNGGSLIVDEVHTYAHIFDELAADGFIVVGMNSGISSASSRQTLTRCAIEWAYEQWSESSRLNCDLVLMGHSVGGYVMHDFVADPPTRGDQRLRAVVAIAPTSIFATDPSTEVAPSDAVPYLVVHGSTDEDNMGDGTTNYDRMAVEDPPDVAVPPLPSPDKVMVWVYRVGHYAWGGQDLPPGPEVDRARAVSGFYIPTFLRWQIYGEMELRHWFFDPLTYDGGATSFPSSVADFTLWADIYADDATGAYDVLGGRPLLQLGVSQARDEMGSRLQIDTMWREDELACNDPAQPVLSPSAPLGEDVSLLGALDSADVCFATSLSQTLPSHSTFALQVPWGAASDGDGLRWQLSGPGDPGVDLSMYDHFSLRLGRRTGPFGTREPFAIRVQLDSGEGPGSPVVYDRIVAQDNSFGTDGVFMHTVRVPLADLCSPDFDITDVRAISIVAPQANDGVSLLHVDSLEFTRHDEDTAAACP